VITTDVRNRFKLILFCMIFMLALRSVTAQDCNEYCINITYINGTCRVTPDNCTENSEDWQAGGDANCTSVNESIPTCCCYLSIFVTTTTTITTTTTLANNTALLSDFVISEQVFIGDYVTAKVRLSNAITGTGLDGQDCISAAYLNDTGMLVKWWNTQCISVVDSNGNLASNNTICPLSDTNGNYYFQQKILADDGFESGRWYNLTLNCNRKSISGLFYVDVTRPPDIWGLFEWMQRYPGIILIAIIALILLALLIYLAKRLIQ
jgi:hypothetical protein